MSVAGRPQQSFLHPEFCRHGSKSMCLCGGRSHLSGPNDHGERAFSLKGKAKAVYPFTMDDDFVGDVTTEDLHPELDLLWRTASAAHMNRNGRHKSPLSRFSTIPCQAGSNHHGNQPVWWPHAAEGNQILHDNLFTDVDHNQRTHRVSQSLAHTSIKNAGHQNDSSQPESSRMANHDVKQHPWQIAWKDPWNAERNVPPEETNSDDEILIPRTTTSQARWTEGQERMTRRGQQLAQEARARRWATEAAVSQKYVVFGSNIVSYAAGLDIRKIVPGFNLCSINVKDLHAGATMAEVADIMLMQGVYISDFYVVQVYNVGRTSEATVLIDRHYPQAIAQRLEGFRLRHDASEFIPPNSMTFNGQPPSLSVSWEVMNKPLIATYRSLEEALKRAGELNGMMWKGRRLRVSVIESHPRASTLPSVRIANPPDHAETDFEFCCFIGTLSVQSSRGAFCDYLESLPVVCDYLGRQNGVLLNSLQVFPVDNDGVAKIEVNFDNWESVRHAYESIHIFRPGFGYQGPKLRAWRPRTFPYHYSTYISKRQHVAQMRLWDALSEDRDEALEEGAGIFIEDAEDTVLVSVLGDDQKAVGALKVRTESLIAGEELGVAFWHPNFLRSHESQAFFDRIYEETGVLARANPTTQSLRLYGEAGWIQYARQLIEEEVQRLGTIPMTEALHGRMMDFFAREGLGRLKELIGGENVKLDLASRPRTITVKGGPEASHHLHRLFEEARSADQPVSMNIDEENMCPVCYTHPSNPELLGCGHSYCAGCLKHLLSSAADSKKFPIVCIGDEATCGSAFPIPFLQRFLPRHTFQRLLEDAFTCYLEQHPQEFGCCPTADCKQVYRRHQHATSLQCPSCFVPICAACAEESHGNLACEESRFQRDPAMQQMANERLGFKKCPQCQAWIEKDGGCNHLQCGCGAHICWRCMGVFSAGEIYAHMTNSHGGIHAEEFPPDFDEAGAFFAPLAIALPQIGMERGGPAWRRRVNRWLHPVTFQ